jgi:hypothetical protein
MSDGANILQVAMKILDYMRRYPDAADTEQHITHWWLKEGEAEQEPGVVASALQMLVRNERIERVELPDNRVVYRLRKMH